MSTDGRTETDFVHELIPKICETGLAVVWRNNSGTAILAKGRGAINVGTAGISDIVGMVRGGPRGGHIVSYEIKSATAKWTQAQRDWLALVRELDGVACDYRYDSKVTWDENLKHAVEALGRAIRS